MSRRSKPAKRIPAPDPMYNSVDIAKFINRLMKRGKKSIAQKIFYSSMDKIQEKTKEAPMEVFKKALTNATPLIEVKARRIGGSTYQVPVEVRPARQQTMAIRWLVMFSRKRGERTMEDRVFGELRDALNGQGGAFKKKIDTHKMAEANKAFAHFRW